MALLLLALVSALVPSSLGRPLTTSRALSEAGACAQVPGFDFYPGFDSPGGDTVLLPGSAYVLAMNCDAQQPLCQAFTSQGVVGYLKNAVLPRESWIPLKSTDPCQGLYVRQTTIINTPNAAASKCTPVFSYLSMADTDTVDDFSDLECADNANLKAATRKCSNDDTCRAFSISSAANRWCTKDAAGPTASTQDTCFYTKNLEVCPKIEGYTFTVNSDHRGSDLSCDNSLDPMSAAIKCSANQACAGFNLDYNDQHTCYKSSTINQVFNNQVCFYTKVNSVAAATCGTYNGLWVDLDTDHTGDDISCINPGSNLDAVAADCIANANCAAFSFNAASSQACTKSKATPVVQASGTCLFTKTTPPSGQRVLFGFAGAYAYNGNYKNPSLPAGTVPPVDPSSVPVVSGVETWVAIKTARDFYRDGAFFLGTDAPWDPATVIAAKQAGRRVSISFGGFSFPWEDPSNSATAMTWDKWQDNAVASIDTLVQSYHSDGIDIKYESAAPAAIAADGTWVGFSDSWCSVFSRLKAAWPNLAITLSPATGTMAPYRKLYQACPQFISWVNWQAYADPAGFANQQASVNMAADAFGGIGNIAIGLVSDNTDVVTKRGTGDYSDAVALMSSFPDARGANIWQFENSVIRGYSLEQSLFPVLG